MAYGQYKKKMVLSIQQPDGEYWKKLHKKSPRVEDVWYFPAPLMKKQQTKAINKRVHGVCSRGSAERYFFTKEFLEHYVKATKGCLKWMM